MKSAWCCQILDIGSHELIVRFVVMSSGSDCLNAQRRSLEALDFRRIVRMQQRDARVANAKACPEGRGIERVSAVMIACEVKSTR
jgi:hypothetical protein